MQLTPDLLLRAYALGVFPMAESRSATEIRWIDPLRRTHIPLEGFHVSKSLARHLRRLQARATLNQAFRRVVESCADRPETWINASILEAYAALYRAGHAHSVEVWDGDRLIGGVYGVTLGAAFFGESMFSRATDGSKMALTFLVHRLRAGGFRLFDVQFMTEHLRSLGAEEIPRAQYHRRLKAAIGLPATLSPPGYAPALSEVLQTFGRSQISTQTS